MTTTETQAVLAANAAFYQALREGDYITMQRLWTRRRHVSCQHPGGPTIEGRTAVMASWRRILRSGRPLPVKVVAPKAVVIGGSAFVLCREEVGEVHMMASNCFVREAAGWRMLSHQAVEIPGR